MHTSKRTLLRISAILAAASAVIPFARAANPAPGIGDAPVVEPAPGLEADRGRGGWDNDRDRGPRFAPPAPRREVVRRAPSSRHIWVSGYWMWDRGHYIWSPGYWIVPPRRDVVWIAPHWDRRGNAYYFVPGRWATPYVPARYGWR